MPVAPLYLGLFFILFATTASFGETVYVSDQLLITLRSGPDESSQLIRTLKTDTPLEVLKKEKGYYWVKTSEGEEGYVSSYYTTRKTPKTFIISELNARTAQLQKTVDNLQNKENALERQVGLLKGEEESLRGQLAAAESGRQEAQREHEQIKKEYADLQASTSDVIKVISERDALSRENEQLASRLKRIEGENTDLLQMAAIKWFLAGAGVLAGGWILGRISRKKRSSYG